MLLLAVAGLFVAAVSIVHAGPHDTALLAIQNATATRAEALIDAYYGSPVPALTPVVDGTPVGCAGYALAALWKNEDLANANSLIVTLDTATMPGTSTLPWLPPAWTSAPSGGQSYETAFGDGDDYWAMGELIRIWYLFRTGSTAYGGAFAGRLTSAADAAIKDIFWNFIQERSRLSDATNPDHWYLVGSENHDTMRKSYYLLGTQMLLTDASYQNLTMGDGNTLMQHYLAWSAYLTDSLKERAERGLLVEIASPTYAKYTLQSVYNLMDFAGSGALQDEAHHFIDLWWADLAQEQVAAVRGGAKARCYGNTASLSGRYDGSFPFCYLYFDLPNSTGPAHPSALILATSNYVTPLPVMDAALYGTAAGAYSYVSTRPALGDQTSASPAGRTFDLFGDFVYHFVFPSELYRYTYVTPNYTLGAFTIDRSLVNPDGTPGYSALNTQDRWMGVNFLDTTAYNSRVFAAPFGSAHDNSACYSGINGVANQQTMIVQKLTEATFAFGMQTYFSSDFTLIENGGWIFGYNAAGTGYVGVKPASSGYTWMDENATLKPSEGAYIDAGSPTTVFNSGTTFAVKNSTTAGRMGYLKFDLTPVPGTATPHATLQIYCSALSGASTATLWTIQDNTWSQSSLTWNNSPNHSATGYSVTTAPGATATQLGTVTVAGVGWCTFDVTAAVSAALQSASGNISFMVVGGTHDNFNVLYSSATSANAPVLSIYAPPNTFAPAGDTTIKNGTAAGSNFGSATTLNVINSTSSGAMSYLNFNISSYANTPVTGAKTKVLSARIRLWAGSVSGGSSTTHQMYGLANNPSWSQATITWNSGPDNSPTGYAVTTGASLLSSNTVTAAGTWYDYDVTDFVNTELLAGVTSLSFLVDSATADAVTVQYNSAEATSNQPELILKTTASDYHTAMQTYIDAGNPTTNDQGASTLAVKNGTSAASWRMAYLTFNLAAFPGVDTLAAHLRLYVSAKSAGSTVHDVYGLLANPWSSGGSVTWNSNSPDHDSGSYSITNLETDAFPLRSKTVPAAGQWVDFDVTSYVSGQLKTGNKVVNLLIASENPDGINVLYSSDNSSNRPYLEIQPETWAQNNDEFAPVVIQAGTPSDYGSNFANFMNAVKSNTFSMTGTQFEYVGEGSSGDFVWPTTATGGLPTINGTPVNLAPSKTFSSPYISASYGSPVITLYDTGGNASTVDFTYGTMNLTPAADGYVENGTGNTGTNYGGQTTIGVKNDTSTGRISYLRFDASALTATQVKNAVLSLTVSAMSTGSVAHQVYGLTNNSWDPTTMTWNTGSPNHDLSTYSVTGIGSTAFLLGQQPILSSSPSATYSVDVTAFVNSQLAAGVKVVSFMIFSNTPTGFLNVNYNSSHASSNQPNLSIIY